jgi:hypothetical protein
MYVWMYTLVCLYLYVCMYVYVCICMNICIFIYVCIFVYVCICQYFCMYVYVSISVIGFKIYIHIHTYTNSTCIYIYTGIYAKYVYCSIFGPYTVIYDIQIHIRAYTDMKVHWWSRFWYPWYISSVGKIHDPYVQAGWCWVPGTMTWWVKVQGPGKLLLSYNEYIPVICITYIMHIPYISNKFKLYIQKISIGYTLYMQSISQVYCVYKDCILYTMNILCISKNFALYIHKIWYMHDIFNAYTMYIKEFWTVYPENLNGIYIVYGKYIPIICCVYTLHII